MNTGKIMTGFSLVLLSIAMMVSPSGAFWTDESCEMGCGDAPLLAEAGCPAIQDTNQMALFILINPQTETIYPNER